jgi:alkaline phosphatase
MKWRAILAMVFVLLLFGAFAYLYVNTFVRKHQHAVILFVVDGMDLNTLNLARQQLGRGPSSSEPDDPQIGDARRRVAYRSDILSLDSFWNIALLNLQDAAHPHPDEGADATAIACGVRVDNGYVAMNARNEPLPSLIYAAEQAQRATGLITTSSLVRATPVAFYSTSNGSLQPYRNAQDLVYSDINVVLGGGAQYFTPATPGNELGRPDGRNLLDEAVNRGYELVRTRDELNRLSTWRTHQILGVFAPDNFYFSALQPENSSQPSLAEMTRLAISTLNHNLNGYFLVVAPGLVARASEQNLGKLAVNEIGAVDEAIDSAIEYAGSDALVLVTNSYNLGAIDAPATPPALPAPPLLAAAASPDKSSDPSPSAAQKPSPTWIDGPGGPPQSASDQDWLRQRFAEGSFSTNAPGLLQPEVAYSFQVRALPLDGPAWLASRGEGASQLSGFFNNTDLFDIIAEQF